MSESSTKLKPEAPMGKKGTDRIHDLWRKGREAEEKEKKDR